MYLSSEIPIFGSSRAAGSYIPDLLDTNCYNYGIEKTEHKLIEVFLKNEFRKNKTTPIIINFDYDIWANWIGDPSNYIPNLQFEEIRNLFLKEDSWYYHVYGIRFYGFYQHYFKTFYASLSKKNFINKGGFFLREKTPIEDLNEDIRMRSVHPAEYCSIKKYENTFSRLLSTNKGRKIFIVLAPYHNSFMKTLKGKELADIYLEKLKKLPNVFVLDYSLIEYPDAYYKNTGHLNYIGAKRFSADLKKDLHSVASGYFN